MQNFFWWQVQGYYDLNAIAINRQKLKLRAKEFNFFAIDQEKIGSNFVIWKMPWKKAEVWLFVYICVCKCKITFFLRKVSSTFWETSNFNEIRRPLLHNFLPFQIAFLPTNHEIIWGLYPLWKNVTNVSTI